MAETPRGNQSAKQLEDAALRYLERFSSSTTNLRRVLVRRVKRIAMRAGVDGEIAEAGASIDAIIEKLTRLGLLNDREYAENKTASLHRRGASARKIAAVLNVKGLGPELVKAALDSGDADSGISARPGGDLAAAAALARRRRYGPYRQPEQRDAAYQKDLAAFARAGFSRRIAEQVLRSADTEALAELVAEISDIQ